MGRGLYRPRAGGSYGRGGRIKERNHGSCREGKRGRRKKEGGECTGWKEIKGEERKLGGSCGLEEKRKERERRGEEKGREN